MQKATTTGFLDKLGGLWKVAFAGLAESDGGIFAGQFGFKKMKALNRNM